MHFQLKPITRSLVAAGAMAFALAAMPGFAPQTPCGAKPAASKAGANPCAAKNPCAARNPCAAKNPCAARNPCAAGDKVNPKLVTRPKGYKPYKADHAALAKEGEALYKNTKLSTNGVSCNTC